MNVVNLTMKRQKMQTFCSALIALLAGGLLSGGYAAVGTPLFAQVLGGLLLAAGLVQLAQELLDRQPAAGSADLLLGAGKLIAGLWVLLHTADAAAQYFTLPAAVMLYHGLYLLQQASTLRRARRQTAVLLAGMGAVAAAAALLPLCIPADAQSAFPLELCLFADGVALLAAGVLLLFVRAPKAAAQPAEKPAEKPAAQSAEKPTAQPAEKPAEKPAAQSAEKPAADADEDSGAAFLQGLGRLAARAKKRAGDTAKATVSGFRDGLHDGD